MGRHRRHAAGRAATGRATGGTETNGSFPGGRDPQDSYEGEHATMGIAPYLRPEAYGDTYTRSHDYLFATDDDYARATDTGATAVFGSEGYTPSGGSAGRGAGRRRRKRVATPVRAGLLGVSAAVALGTVAVATGAVPGLENYRLGGGSGSDTTQAAETPTNAEAQQGGTSGSASASASTNGRGGTAASRGSERSASPTPTPSASTTSATPSEKPTTEKPAHEPTATPSKKPSSTPSHTATKAPERGSTPGTVSPEAAVEAEVLRLVNEERSKVGCSALAANSSLTELAESFSADMAARGFFDHTDPDGASPWDRAAKAGITDLGGENIARGQADAAAVMEAWMNSPGHRANILNCDFKTLGVGVHYGSGGPWWTQDFGY
ncbi:CAP domain-containing protein [Streptomyces griseus]|uniref:CAP domain-containing protein n=1 Tax=Streptomyces griseus TaxID=1911 RepID=UPI00056B2A6F|nr:CAP domain-containing protein [Streptomyces griseus]